MPPYYHMPVLIFSIISTPATGDPFLFIIPSVKHVGMYICTEKYAELCKFHFKKSWCMTSTCIHIYMQ